MYFCSRQVCFKELKIKLILLNLHGAKRSYSEVCSLKKCTLPYIYFVFKCLVLYFGIQKEWLEKSLKGVQVGKGQEKAQSEKDSHSKNRGGKTPN